MKEIIDSISSNYSNLEIDTNTILSVLLVTLLLAIYEFLAYRYVSKRAFYNKSFNISITIIPLFLSTIIMCLQSNIIITLGTIGALAIIRFRTAIKDPVDMLYILWSIHIGITCGCMLYEVAFTTSLVVTFVLLILDRLTIGKKPYILVIHTDNDINLYELLHKVGKIRIKSRNYTSKGMDYTIEISTKKIDELMDLLKNSKDIVKFSLIEYDADDIL